ncbi:MAG: DJ-1/PfpI family protein [Haliea sp.]|jgi:putative intracellular protease/amidase|nr:DJ-1/PfpI family protein [Haliea sp.]
MSNTPLTLGAILYPGFEMLDMFGPLEMFSMIPPEQLTIHMVAEQAGPVPAAMGMAIGGPKTVADYGFDDAPELDILLLPGGFGTLPELENPRMLGFLSQRSKAAQITCSVCSGSALLAKAGVLDGYRATSNKQLFVLATSQSDKVTWVEEARWVDDGPVVTASGVSAGTDMALAIIQRLWGEEVARQTAEFAEYTWHEDADSDPFVSELNKAAGMLG